MEKLKKYTVLFMLFLFFAEFRHGQAWGVDGQPAVFPNLTTVEIPGILTIDVEGDKKPKRYLVRFKLLEKLPRPIVVEVGFPSGGAVILSPKSPLGFHEVDHDQTVVYSFRVVNPDGTTESIFSRSIEIPKDFVVSGELGSNLEVDVNRFFVERLLTTNGFDLSVKTNGFHVLAEEAIIETFPEGSKASVGTNGKGGGNISISTGMAKGRLRVYMRGQNGGDGKPGEPFDKRAEDGTPPAGGLFCPLYEIRCPFPFPFPPCPKCPVCTSCPSPSRDLVRPISGDFSRDGGVKDNFRVSYAGIPKRDESGVDIGKNCYCITRDGTDGADGAPGRPGSDGGDGGNAGNFFFVISGNFDDYYAIDVPRPGYPEGGGIGGNGGAGGQGGRGQLGGKGPFGGKGQPGGEGPFGGKGRQGLESIIVEPSCMGEWGKDGKDGPDGKSGNPGSKGRDSVCKKIRGDDHKGKMELSCKLAN